MTEVQKEKIRTLRDQGYGYGTIAKQLDLSVSCVTMHCLRNGLGGKSSASSKEPLCPQCGKPVTQREGVKRRRFCSDGCRLLWWNSHRDQLGHYKTIPFTCKECGKPFMAYPDSERKYCSHRCYINRRFKGKS